VISSFGLQLVILVAGLICLLLVWYRPTWGVFAAISIAGLLDCFDVATPADAAASAASSGGGLNIYADDVACAMLLLTGLLLLIRHRKGMSRDEMPGLFLMILITLSVGRGVGIYTLKQAGNSARNLLTFVTPALAIMMLRPVLRLDAGRLSRWFGWAGSCLCAIALLRWAGVLAIPLTTSSEWDVREVVRVLASDYAIVVGQAFIAAIFILVDERRRGWWWWAGAAMFGAVTLALQHRSVWVATAAGVAWLAFRTGRLSPTRWLGLGATAVVGLGFIMIADPAIMISAREIVDTGVNETQDQHSTWAWRVQGYTEATDRVLASGTIDLLIGPPAGWAANTLAGFASTHIHSRFVDTLAYYGLLGASALIVWFVMLIQRCRRRAQILSKRQVLSRGSAALLQALVISQIVYLVPYFGGILQGSVVGLLWLAATQKPLQTIGQRLAPVYARARFTAGSAIEAVQQ
jgi:hypothetical protein